MQGYQIIQLRTLLFRLFWKKNEVDTWKIQRGDSFLNFQIVKFPAPFPTDPIIIYINCYTESPAFYSMILFVSDLRYSFFYLTPSHFLTIERQKKFRGPKRRGNNIVKDLQFKCVIELTISLPKTLFKILYN